VKVKVFECPKATCRYRWIPRVNIPKECPNCKHRFVADWGLKPKVLIAQVKSKQEFLKLKREIAQWNEKGRWR